MSTSPREHVEIKPREPARLVPHNWPFKYSIDPVRGLVLNVHDEAPVHRVPLKPERAASWSFGSQVSATGVDLGALPDGLF